MASFTLAASVPTSTTMGPRPTSYISGTNNTGFGISPKYVNAAEYAVAYLQAATDPTVLAMPWRRVRTYYGRPLDGQLVPFQLPDPWSLEVIGQPPLGAPVGVVVDDPNEFDIWYF